MKGAGGGRLASIDALRGITVAAMLLVNNPGDWGHVHAPLLHADWHGCTPTDLIFPFFLFLVGVSMAFSVAPRAADASMRPALARGVLARALRILVAGLLLHALAWWLLQLPHFRVWGVLQRIGVCAALAGLLAVYARQSVQWIMLAALLTAYAWILLAADTLQPLVNPASRLDTLLFAPWIYQYNAATGLGHDPEGLVSTLGAVATTLTGLLAGQLLRAGRTARLAVFGAAMMASGLVSSQWLPFNKHLWAPSYVGWTSGLAVFALLAAHAVLDRRGWPALGRRFGVNAITVYLGASVASVLLGATGIWQVAWEAMAATLPDHLQTASLLVALAFVTLWWGVAWWLDARRIYLKI